MKILKLNKTHLKILYSIYVFNEQKGYLTKDGLEALLKGDIADDTLKNIPSYGTLISIKGRQLASLLNALCRYGYLRLFYFENDDNKYYAITEKGKVEALKFIDKASKLTAKTKRLKTPVLYRFINK